MPDLATILQAEWSQPEGNAHQLYYFYPDGVYVWQATRRREMNAHGRWKLTGDRIELSEEKADSGATRPDRSIAVEQIVDESHLKIQAGTVRVASSEILEGERRQLLERGFKFDVDVSDMAYSIVVPPPREWTRIGELPDRTENVYWGLGDDASYQRGTENMFRELGYRPISDDRPSR